MTQEELWYGFLEAGDRSTPVARDPKLTTGNPDTVYMYNLQRNEIIEYKRAIAEPKLRELKANEGDALKELKSAFAKALKEFTPRRARPPVEAVPVAVVGKKKGKASMVEEDVADESDDFDNSFFEEGSDEE
jgi:hypothetical protein